MEKIAYTLIWVSSFLWVAENFPQIYKIIKTKSVEGISFWYFFICWLAYVSYIIGNIILGNYIIALSHVPSFILLKVIMYLIWRYKK